MKFWGPASVASFIGLSMLLDKLKRRDADNVVRNVYEAYGVPALKALSDGKENLPTNSTLGLKLHAQKEIASKAANFLLTATGDHKPPGYGYRPGLQLGRFVHRMVNTGFRSRWRKTKSRKRYSYKKKYRSMAKRYYPKKTTYKKSFKKFKPKKVNKRSSSFQPIVISIPKARPDPSAYTFYTEQY